MLYSIQKNCKKNMISFVRLFRALNIGSPRQTSQAAASQPARQTELIRSLVSLSSLWTDVAKRIHSVVVVYINFSLASVLFCSPKAHRVFSTLSLYSKYLPKHYLKAGIHFVPSLDRDRSQKTSPSNLWSSNLLDNTHAMMLGFPAPGIPDKTWQPAFAVIETTMGAITLEMYWKHAPITCRNFMELIRRGYYNNTKFHRVIRDFMIQGGDPTATGKGGQSIYGPSFDDEICDELKHTGAGILSMANSGPNSNGSQFFITLAPTQWLDGKHTIFGRVTAGMQVVKRIGLVECDKEDCPVDDIRIDRAYISRQNM